MRVYIGKPNQNAGVTKYHTRKHGPSFREISLNEEQIAALGLEHCKQCENLIVMDTAFASAQQTLDEAKIDLREAGDALREKRIEIRLLFHPFGKRTPRVLYTNWKE